MHVRLTIIAAGEVIFADVLLLPNGMSKVSRFLGWFTGLSVFVVDSV